MCVLCTYIQDCVQSIRKIYCFYTKWYVWFTNTLVEKGRNNKQILNKKNKIEIMEKTMFMKSSESTHQQNEQKIKIIIENDANIIKEILTVTSLKEKIEEKKKNEEKCLNKARSVFICSHNLLLFNFVTVPLWCDRLVYCRISSLTLFLFSFFFSIVPSACILFDIVLCYVFVNINM